MEHGTFGTVRRTRVAMVFNGSIKPTSEEAQAVRDLLADINTLGYVPVPEGEPKLTDPLLLLRFVRGYANEKDARAKTFDAYCAMLAYRAEHDIDSKRAELIEAGNGVPVWPASMPRFKPLVDCIGMGTGLQLGATCDGMRAVGMLIHLWDLSKVIKAGLADMLLDLHHYGDEYWSCMLHAASLGAGHMVGQVTIVHVGHMSPFQFGPSALRLLPQVMSGSKHYPESVARICCVGNSKAALTLYKNVVLPFVPKHTCEKLCILGREERHGCCVELPGVCSKAGERLASVCCVCGHQTADAAAKDAT